MRTNGDWCVAWTNRFAALCVLIVVTSAPLAAVYCALTCHESSHDTASNAASHCATPDDDSRPALLNSAPMCLVDAADAPAEITRALTAGANGIIAAAPRSAAADPALNPAHSNPSLHFAPQLPHMRALVLRL